MIYFIYIFAFNFDNQYKIERKKNSFFLLFSQNHIILERNMEYITANT